MRFRNRETGEVINVLRHNERGTFAECINNNGEVYSLQFRNLFCEYERVIEDTTINWEQIRDCKGNASRLHSRIFLHG